MTLLLAGKINEPLLSVFSPLSNGYLHGRRARVGWECSGLLAETITEGTKFLPLILPVCITLNLNDERELVLFPKQPGQEATGSLEPIVGGVCLTTANDSIYYRPSV